MALYINLVSLSSQAIQIVLEAIKTDLNKKWTAVQQDIVYLIAFLIAFLQIMLEIISLFFVLFAGNCSLLINCHCYFQLQVMLRIVVPLMQLKK